MTDGLQSGTTLDVYRPTTEPSKVRTKLHLNQQEAGALFGCGVNAFLRFARKGQGKSGGFRSVVLFRQGERAFFVYAFAKSDRDNVAQDEVQAFKVMAAEALSLSEAELQQALETGKYMEVSHEIQK